MNIPILSGLGYKIDVELFEVRNGSLLVSTDKAKRFTGAFKGSLTGESYYLLKKRKIKVLAPEFVDVFLTNKGKTKLYVWSPSPNYYFPMGLDKLKDLTREFYDFTKLGKKLNSNLEMVDEKGEIIKNEDGQPVKITMPNLIPKDTDVDNFLQNEYRRAAELWQKRGGLEKWMPIMLVLVCVVGMAIIFQIVNDGMVKMSANFASAASQFVEVSKNELLIHENFIKILQALDKLPPTVIEPTAPF